MTDHDLKKRHQDRQTQEDVEQRISTDHSSEGTQPAKQTTSFISAHGRNRRAFKGMLEDFIESASDPLIEDFVETCERYGVRPCDLDMDTFNVVADYYEDVLDNY